MKNILNRIEKLETHLKPSADEDDLSHLTKEELHREIVDLAHKNKSHNGYFFKSLEEYDIMSPQEQTEYVNEMSKVLESWLEEKKRAEKGN